MTEYSLDEIERAIGDYPRRPVPVDYDYAPIEQPLSEVVVTQVTTSADVVSIEPMIGIDAVDLLELDLPPLRWIVPDLLPEGTEVLAAPPKIGKSCLVYQIAVEVAIGGELFGRRVAPGAALYLALEDGKRRGQDRLRAALAGRTMPRGRLEVRWGARKIGAGLEDDIAAWLDAHPDALLVAIDTLGKVRPRTTGRRNAYEVDVEDLGRLQDLFRDRRVALLIVHHARKEAGDDFLASVSGTYGLTGSVDTIASLRRKRLESFGTVLITGRDVPDAEIPVRFDGMTWHEAPPSLPEASFERAEVYGVIEAQGPIFPAAIAEQLGTSRQSVQNMVAKLYEAGAVRRATKGYEAVEPTRARVFQCPRCL
jgi:DNA-binding Lrp family transcriptional regulator